MYYAVAKHEEVGIRVLFRGHTVKNSFGRGRSIVRMAGSLYLCRVVIGGECRKFVPCVVLCGMDLDRLDDFLQFVYCTVYIFRNF